MTLARTALPKVKGAKTPTSFEANRLHQREGEGNQEPLAPIATCCLAQPSV